MGRWTQYDEVCPFFYSTFQAKSLQDEYRLPEGMKRIGYDSDTGRYYYRDRDGVIWQGAEGAEFSEMTRGEKLASAHVMSTDLVHSYYRKCSSFSGEPRRGPGSSTYQGEWVSTIIYGSCWLSTVGTHAHLLTS
jgi:hypothetical protein